MIEIVNAVRHVTAMRNREPNFHSIVGLALWSYNTARRESNFVTTPVKLRQ